MTKAKSNRSGSKARTAGNRATKVTLKSWAHEHYKGMENALTPSFSADFKTLDEDGIRNDVRNSIRHGFFSSICGPVGVTPDEYKRFLEVVCAEARGKILTGAIVEGASLNEDLDLLEHAEKVGCSHVFMNAIRDVRPRTEDQLFEAYRRRINATRLAVVLYASVTDAFRQFGPSGVPLSVFDRLAELPNVVAVKLTQPMNFATAFQVCERLSDRLLVGPVNLDFVPVLAKHYRVQWSGQWNVEAVQSPDKPYGVQFMDLLNRHRFDEAMKVYWQLEPALSEFYALQSPLILKGGHPWCHMKYFQWCVGGNGGLIRDLHQPVDRVPILDEPGRRRIKETYRKVGIEPVSAPEEEFLVGKANYAKGIRRGDLTETPLYT
jgi:4-hydroxy-tetrahydrodipicolinate synthase